MSRITYEIFDCEGEIADVKKDGRDITFRFVNLVGGYLSLSERSYEIENGEVKVKLEDIKNGTHLPRITTEKKQILLPLLEKRDGELNFPESEEAYRSLSLKTARLTARLAAVESRLNSLNAYVYGSTCL